MSSITLRKRVRKYRAENKKCFFDNREQERIDIATDKSSVTFMRCKKKKDSNDKNNIIARRVRREIRNVLCVFVNNIFTFKPTTSV